MSSESLALRIERLAKCYRIYGHPRDRLLQAIVGSRKTLYREFWALHEISFELPRGNTFGIVGRNGSGKSTLLQLICGTLTPTSGTIERHGRIGALLELGSGFNPEFTGLENIYMNGSILGLTKREIDNRLDEILAFADIGDFVRQPVKTYSSGMSVRLAFAVQAHCDPQILVVDEALAVGDELFQKKCYSHLEGLKERGTSILLVTHSCAQINQQCDTAILLHKGSPRLIGEPYQITALYQQLMNAPDEEWDSTLGPASEEGNLRQVPAAPGRKGGPWNTESPPSPPEDAEGTPPDTTQDLRGADLLEAHFDPNLRSQSTIIYPPHGAEIIGVDVLSTTDEIVNVLPAGATFRLRFRYRFQEGLGGVRLACHIANHTGSRISGQVIPPVTEDSFDFPAGSEWEMTCEFLGCLWPGTYFVGGGIASTLRPERKFIHRVIDFAVFRIVAQAPMQQVGAANLVPSHSPRLRRRVGISCL